MHAVRRGQKVPCGGAERQSLFTRCEASDYSHFLLLCFGMTAFSAQCVFITIRSKWHEHCLDRCGFRNHRSNFTPSLFCACLAAYPLPHTAAHLKVSVRPLFLWVACTDMYETNYCLFGYLKDRNCQDSPEKDYFEGEGVTSCELGSSEDLRCRFPL